MIPHVSAFWAGAGFGGLLAFVVILIALIDGNNNRGGQA